VKIDEIYVFHQFRTTAVKYLSKVLTFGVGYWSLCSLTEHFPFVKTAVVHIRVNKAEYNLSLKVTLIFLQKRKHTEVKGTASGMRRFFFLDLNFLITWISSAC